MNSTNFEFLRPDNNNLANLCGLAEAVLYIDPGSTLVRLRSFADELTKTIYKEELLPLATDAQERRSMIHTYLALTGKGHGPEEDRQLILQTLFRPSTTDMVKYDQSPTQLVDSINRL